ncbi:MAG: proline--tRNA ligase [Mariprofundaceae bacterium]|nr:proline--tRNA ligase [Mariprofundaceae bacterium]
MNLHAARLHALGSLHNYFATPKQAIQLTTTSSHTSQLNFAIMRYSRFFAPTLRDDPADAEVISHKLLLRAGFIRRVTSGVYDFLPMGLRVLRKIEGIVREEMARAGAQELLLPMVQPSELWKKSGRWEKYGNELLRFKDRHAHESCLGPTHEEVICDLVSRELRSYKQLPMNLYQIQSKFRDEVRPRFGLMRGREFIMKDAYSFHADEESLQAEYENMFATYQRIFTRLGLKFRAVEADTGSIGGSQSHEFHVLAESGEDLIAYCSHCDYAANVEKGISTRDIPSLDDAALNVIETPNVTSVEDVASFLNINTSQLLKTLIYQVTGGEFDGQTVAACVYGDDTLQEIKLARALNANAIELADDQALSSLGSSKGFVGPQGLRCKIIMDESLRDAVGMVAGANKIDSHVSGLSIHRDVPQAGFSDLREVRLNDGCAHCKEGHIKHARGIEVGQVFALGQQYTKPLEVLFQDKNGKRATATMGCYGIGVSRLVAAVIEQCNDENGMIWPLSLAPFQVVIITMGKSETAMAASEKMYQDMSAAGIEVLWDDRKERPGVKFKDAELMGLPIHVVLGDRGLEADAIEIRQRAGSKQEVSMANVIATVQAILAGTS